MAQKLQQPERVSISADATASSWFGGGLFDCCADRTLCCKTLWCPCLTYREIRTNLYGDIEHNVDPCDPAAIYCFVSCLTGSCFVMGLVGRNEIRTKYNLPGELTDDCCIHFWCHPCALCQEARELRSRPVMAYSPVMSLWGDVDDPEYIHGPPLL